MLDELLARLREPSGTKPVFALSDAWFEVSQLRRKSDWPRLRDACADAIANFQPDFRLGLLWAEANSQLLGFKGLADGVTLIKALCLASTGLESEADGDVLLSIGDKLSELMLKVPISESTDEILTYTSVLNSVNDPARAAKIEAYVAASRRSFYDGMAGDLEALRLALHDFHADSALYGTSSHTEALALLRKIAAAAEEWKRSSAEVDPDRDWWYWKPTVNPAHSIATRKAESALYRIYVEVEGLVGDSPAASHRNWIQVQSYRHTIQPPPASDAAQPPPSGQILVEKRLDRSSPNLYRACSSAVSFPRVIFDFCRDNDDAVRFLRVELDDAVISSITQTAVAGELEPPIEQITFQYARIRWTYTQYGPGGIPVGTVSTSN